MPLIEHNPLWLLPAVPLALFMVHAMMLSVMSFMSKRPFPNRKPATRDELKRRLSALNSTGAESTLAQSGDDGPAQKTASERSTPAQSGDDNAAHRTAGARFRLAPAKAHDYSVEWDVAPPDWRGRYATVWYSDMYRLRLLLDEGRREVRVYESISSFYFMWGFDGWRLRIAGGVTFLAGPLDLRRWRGKAFGMTRLFPPRAGEAHAFDIDTQEARRAIEKVIRGSGWSVRPVVLWFEVKRSVLRVGRAVLPPPLRWWPAKRLWLVLHPVTYAATVGWIMFVAGANDPGAIGFILAFTVVWFGFWGLFVWALSAGSKPAGRKARRRQRRHDANAVARDLEGRDAG